MEIRALYEATEKQLSEIKNSTEEGFSKLSRITENSLKKLEEYLETFVADSDKITFRLEDFAKFYQNSDFIGVNSDIADKLEKELELLEDLAKNAEEMSKATQKALVRLAPLPEIEKIVGEE